MTVGFRSSAESHVGIVRSNNQDAGYAGKQIFFVADGMGGHAGGDVASALVAHEVAKLDEEMIGGPEMFADRLRTELREANRGLKNAVRERPELAGMGTTFCGFLASPEKIVVGHIGDSRLYRFRDNKLEQMTHDHTFVQRLVDSGRITEEEAKTHPRRSVLMRVLGDVETPPDIDTLEFENRPGDTWLLCSDGLCGFVEDDEMEEIIQSSATIEQAVDSLVDRSLSYGAPDNVTVVLVEAIELEEGEESTPGPGFVGSAADDATSRAIEPRTRPQPILRLRPLRPFRRQVPVAETHFEPRVDEYLAELIAETKRRNWRRRIYWLLALLAVIGAIAGALIVGYNWTQDRYFVGTDGDTVIIYQGVDQNIAGISLSTAIEDTGISLNSLTGLEKRQIERSLTAESLDEARDIVARLGVFGA